MSDLYLVLRHRLSEAVQGHDWIEIDTHVLRDARKAKGLSYEAMGRILNVASKTYERWEKAGRVPRQDVHRVAAALNLEIDAPPDQGRIELPRDDELAKQVGELRDQMDRIEQLLLQGSPRSGRRSAEDSPK